MFLHIGISRLSMYGGEQRTVIKPVPKAIESILYEVFGGPEIEPGVNCRRMLANWAVRAAL